MSVTLDAPKIQPARPKDLAATAGVLGVASAAWFAWSQAGGQLPTALMIAAAVLGVLVGVAGFVQRGRVGGHSVHHGNPAAYRTYNRALLFELLAIVLGNLALGRLGLGDYVPCWTIAVMGLHFLPLARLYGIGALRRLAVVVIAAGVLGVLAGVTGWAVPATVACGLGGLAMLATAIGSIRAAGSPVRADRG